MSLLTKQYTATHVTGYQEHIEDISAFIKRIGVRSFVEEYGMYFHDKNPRSEIAGFTIFVQWVLEDARGQIVNPDDIAQEYLNKYPPQPRYRYYWGYGTQSERRRSRRCRRFGRSIPVHRQLKQVCAAEEDGIPIRHKAIYVDQPLWEWDERYPEFQTKSWKEYRKHQYKEA